MVFKGEKKMPLTSDGLDSFRDGLAAGHAAGQEHDLLYAVGFAVGYVWGAFAERQFASRPVLRKEARPA